jgi:hypothetical protein
MGRGPRGRGTTARRGTALEAAPAVASGPRDLDATAPDATVHGRSSAVRPARADRKIDGARQARAQTVVARADPRSRGVPPALAQTGAVRGPDRGTDSDRARGRGPGRTAAPTIDIPTIGTTSRAMSHGGPTTGLAARAEASGIGRVTRRATTTVPDTALAGAGRRAGTSLPAHPGTTRAPTDPIDRGQVAIGPTPARRSSRAAADRHGRPRCRRPRRSARTRRSLPVAVRSRRPSSPDAPPSVSSSYRSAARPSRRSSCMPRTCGSRSSRSKAAR